MKLLWTRARPLALLAAITILYRWKILLTRQFTALNADESVNQGYCWLTYCVRCLQHGILPAWDPYTLGGHSFVGEMQTSGFSPFNALLALFPLEPNGLLSVTLFNWYITTLIFLAMAMMYWLARDLELERPPALIAAICFGLGGTLIRNQSWPDLLQSGIWLPLVFLTCRRALVAESRRITVLYGWGCGLAMGLAVLGGRIHMAMMQAMVVVTLAAYYACFARPASQNGSAKRRLVRYCLIVLLIAVVCFLAGAVQLLPSLQYSSHSIRYTGNSSYYFSSSRIPYFEFYRNASMARSILSLIFPLGFNANYGMGEFTPPYIGIFPMILVVLALLKRWQVTWVRYCCILGIGAWLYSLGPLSLLQGAAYAIVPKIWIIRESSRMLYLTSFTLALLAGYGAQVLLVPREGDGHNPKLDVVLKWAVIGAAGVLGVAGLFNLNSLSYWNEFSIVILLLSYWLYRVIQQGRSRVFAAVVIALILFDLWPYDWTLANIWQLDHDKRPFALRELRNAEGVARYLARQPGPFRVNIDVPVPLNIGLAYSVPTVNGAGATMDTTFMRVAKRTDLLNVRYVLKPAGTDGPGAEYSDDYWKVYRTTGALGEGFVVHRVRQLPLKQIEAALAEPQADLREEAMVEAQPPSVDPATEESRETVVLKAYEPNRIELRVQAISRGLLVLSEIYDAGWRAEVDGRERRVLRVDGGFRGVAVDPGLSTVVFVYRPSSIRIGRLLTVLAFAGGLGLWIATRRRRPEQKTA